jgi:lipopolysaccharide export system protein LptC
MHSRFNPVATLFPLLLIGLLAGLTYWLELASRQQDSAGDGRLRHDPDYIVERFEIRRFDPQGILQHTLRADAMRHFPDDNSTLVQSPHLTYHREPPTYVSAREARVDGKGERVQMNGDVHVTRVGTHGKPDTVLTTEQLDALPDEEVASSQVPVTIVQGRSHVTGSAMSADSKTALYTLEGPVRGIFHRGTAAAQALPQEPAPPVAAPPPRTAKPAAKLPSQPKPKAKTKPKAKPKAKS